MTDHLSAELRTCRLLLDEPASGAWNMSVDEMLLRHVSVTGQPALRIYRWSEPTVSLGYFQTHDDRESHAPSRDCAVVRRRSGGGAIVHHHELTYALAMPIARRWGADAATLYRTIHTAVQDWLQQNGCPTRLYDGPTSDREFLCFHRRSPGDLICGEDKLMGSAQRRSMAALLQHGSLLLRRSKHAPSLPGIEDLTPGSWPHDRLASQLARELLAALALSPVEVELTDLERERVTQISRQRFSSATWTRRR